MNPVTAVFDRAVCEALRQGRDMALTAAIEVCEEFAKSGHSAECCVRALRNLREALPRPPSEGN